LDVKMLIALAGIIIAALSTELNSAVSSILITDITGGLGISHDPGTWFTSLYVTGEVFGMSISPWFAVTLTLRRWSLFVIALTAASSVFVPLAPNLTILFGLRFLQGLCGGLTIPLLMTTALRALPPPIRLYGLAAYALTATFFPNLSAALAALWGGQGDSPLGWQFAFYEAAPLSLVAGVLVWGTMVQDKPQYDRFRKFDWRGALLVLVGFGSLTTMMEQGDRYDWFNSTTICLLGLTALVCLPLLIVNELLHPLPLLNLRMLKRRNLAYGLIALFTFLIITLSSSTIPSTYLQEVQEYRPAQSFTITALVAASQLLLLPMMAVLLNFEWVEARLVSFIGLSCMLAACIGNSLVTDVWQRGEFILWQALASVGEAMIVMPLLMMATNSVVPQEGPFASSLVNTPRAVGEAAGSWLLELIRRWRGRLHSERLTDQAGQDRWRTIQGHGVLRNDPPPLLPNGHPRTPYSFGQFQQTLQHQVVVLTVSDMFLVIAGIVVALMLVLLILPERTYPPRIVFAKK